MSPQAAVSSQSISSLDGKIRATVEQLRAAVREYGKVVYSNSLGAESMVLTDLIWTQVPQIDIFSLDTGRLHEETYSLLDPHHQQRAILSSPRMTLLSVDTVIAG